MLVLLRNTDKGGNCRRCAVQAECCAHGTDKGEYIPDGMEACLQRPAGVDGYYALIEPTQDFDGAVVGAALPTDSGV